MAMTPRERWLALLAGRTPDRIPTDYWATPEFHERFRKDLACPDDESLWRKLNIDRPLVLFPAPRPSPHADDPEADVWGLRFRAMDYGTGIYQEVAHHPLAHAESPADVHAFSWPRPEDFDITPIRQAIEADRGYRPVIACCYEPFLLYAQMRGLEQAFMDLVLNPDIADAILGHLFDIHEEVHRRVFAACPGQIDMTYVAEDLGGQTGPLISLETYRRFLRPNQRKMADLARAHGIRVFYHTDGAARPFIPDLLDVVGIDVLNPIQWRCPGMDRASLVRDFGQRVAFHGAMDNQYTLPFGSTEQVAAEVRENLAIFADARWICAPCHNIQPVSPTANIVTLYETLNEITCP